MTTSLRYNVMMTRPEFRVETDIACTACGCVCDDLTVQLQGDRIVGVECDCPLAKPWFQCLVDIDSLAGDSLDQRASDWRGTISQAAQILAESDAPLIYGLSRSSTPGQRAAVELADSLGATIDTTASICHGPSIMAIQDVGESTSTLGEVAVRADLVIFWGANPAVSHPRHFERYSLEPSSEILPRGRQDRQVILINSSKNETSEVVDRTIIVEESRDFELIWRLREMIRSDRNTSEADWSSIPADVLWLVEQLKSCRYGVIFFGLGIAQSPRGHLVVSGLLELVAELNAITRFTARRLRVPGDVAGADSVLCWQTGYPFAVNLGRGYPRYNPGEFSAQELLERQEVDSCVLIGTESIQDFSREARRHLDNIPTIVLEYPHLTPTIRGTVHFTTSVYGIHAPGTAYRMDETPIPLRRICFSPLPTDETVLKAILNHLKSGQVTDTPYGH